MLDGGKNYTMIVFKEEDVVSLPYLRYLAQKQCVQIDQPWLADLLHLPQSCSVSLKKPPILYDSSAADLIALPFLHINSSYLYDVTRVKLRTVHNHSEDTIETIIEIVNDQRILFSFQRVIPLGSLNPRRDPQLFINDELSSSNLCGLGALNTGSPIVFCLESYQPGRSEDHAAINIAEGLHWLENVTTLILHNSAVEPCLVALEPNSREELAWHSTVHSLVIYSYSQFDSTGADILQSLLRVSKGRKIAGIPFRSVTLAIPSTTLVVSSGELAALDEYIEGFEFLAGDDALDWDVDKYFVPDYDPLQVRRDKSAFDVDLS